LEKLTLLLCIALVLVLVVFPRFLTPYSVLLGVAVPLSIISFLATLAVLGRADKSLATLGILLLVLIPLVSPWLVPLSYANIFGGREIEGIASGIVAGEPNAELVARNINSWVHNNLRDANKYGFGETFFDFLTISEPPYIWRRSSNPSEIIFYRYGACEEYARLFVGLATEAKLSSWRVHSPGEDHVWTEVEIDNSPVFFDPSNNIFGNTKEYEDMRNVQVSKVYAFYENGENRDVTSRYTDTGRLTVLVTKDNEPVNGATVIVKSKFLWQRDPEKYDCPRNVTESSAGNNGICVFDLGGNDYLIRAESDGLWDEENVAVVENDNNAFVELQLS
jgi:hypothetical protein